MKLKTDISQTNSTLSPLGQKVQIEENITTHHGNLLEMGTLLYRLFKMKPLMLMAESKALKIQQWDLWELAVSEGKKAFLSCARPIYGPPVPSAKIKN